MPIRKIVLLTLNLFILSSLFAQTQLNLKQALQLAKTNNPVLKTEYYNRKVSESDIITAKLRPNLKLNNQTLQLISSSNLAKNTSWYQNNNRQVWWQLTKNIQLPSQRMAKISLANKQLNLSMQTYTQTEREIYNDVATKWLNIWTITKQLHILNIAKNNIDSLLYINKLRLKNQVITQIDVARTELLASQFQQQIKSVEQSLKSELIQFQFLVGAENVIKIDTSDSFHSIEHTTLDSLLQYAINQRSDIKSIQSGLEVSDANIETQKSLALPQPELGIIWNPQNSVPYFGFFGTIEIPIFSRNQGEIQKSEIIKQQLNQQLTATQSEIKASLIAAFQSYQTQKAIMDEQQNLLNQATYILNSVKYTYLRGGTTIIDFLEAQRSWLSTQQQYYDIRQQYRECYLKLLYISGLINTLTE